MLRPFKFTERVIGVKGKKYSDEEKEKAYALYAVNNSYKSTSKALNIPVSTIATWIKNKPPDDKFEKLRTQNKENFIRRAGDIIDKGMSLLDKRFSRALENEEELDRLIDEVLKNDELSQPEKSNLIKTLRSLQLQDVKAITTAIGTIYDKRALAKGESTENSNITFKLPKELNEYAE